MVVKLVGSRPSSEVRQRLHRHFCDPHNFGMVKPMKQLKKSKLSGCGTDSGILINSAAHADRAAATCSPTEIAEIVKAVPATVGTGKGRGRGRGQGKSRAKGTSSRSTKGKQANLRGQHVQCKKSITCRRQAGGYLTPAV
jgi:hypothetical protein